MKTKRIIKVALVLSSVSVVGFAQDTLELRSGTKVLSKVIEVSTTEIKYKKVENPDGPIYTEDKDNVSTIKYKNGTLDIFPEVKPWLKPVKNKIELPEQPQQVLIADRVVRNTKIERDGKYFMMNNKRYSENRILNEMKMKNDPEINIHIQNSKHARALQPLCFVGIPLAAAGMISNVLSEANGEGQRNNAGTPLLVLSAACLTTSFVINSYHKKQTTIAVELYNQKY